MDRLYSVTELARAVGVSARTIRLYEGRGLILPQRAGNARVYTHHDRARMVLILRGKQLGFSLKDIKEFLDLYVIDTSHVEQMKILVTKVRGRIALLEDKLRAVQTSLDELREIERISLDSLKQKGVDINSA